MSKILVTGSADGLGLLAAQELTSRGHKVYLHARSPQRAKDAKSACPGAQDCLVADLSSLSETKKLAEDLKSLGPWDAIIHSAGVMHGQSGKKVAEGWGTLFAVNTVAPYVLTSLLGGQSKRYVFLSSSMAGGGDISLRNLQHCGYSDSKLHNIMLAAFFGRKLDSEGVQSNAMDPGWVATKMGGAGAPGSPEKAVETYVKLAEDPGTNGKYWGPGKVKDKSIMSDVWEEARQDKLIGELETLTGVKLAS